MNFLIQFKKANLKNQTKLKDKTMQSTSFKVDIRKGKAQSSTTVDDSTSCDSTEDTKRFTAQDIKLQTNMSYAEKLKELEYRSAQTILLEKRIQNMRLRWANKIPSLKLESGQILADDELLVDYSAVVQANANDAHEKITKTIKEALALLRRYYETLENFDNHMLEILEREEARLLEEAEQGL